MPEMEIEEMAAENVVHAEVPDEIEETVQVVEDKKVVSKVAFDVSAADENGDSDQYSEITSFAVKREKSFSSKTEPAVADDTVYTDAPNTTSFVSSLQTEVKPVTEPSQSEFEIVSNLPIFGSKNVKNRLYCQKV